jgi:hypothetical protein
MLCFDLVAAIGDSGIVGKELFESLIVAISDKKAELYSSCLIH